MGEVVPFPVLPAEEQEELERLVQLVVQGCKLGPREQTTLLPLLRKEDKLKPDWLDAGSRQGFEGLLAHIERGEYLLGPRQLWLVVLREQRDGKR